MTDYLLRSATLGLLALQAQAVIPGRTLADCQAFAALFDNTCTSDTPLSSLASHAGEVMECTGNIRCPDASGSANYSSSNPCTFTRKLCVTCSEQSGTTYITV